MQRLLDSDGAQGRLGEILQGRGIGRLGGGDRQHAGELAEVDRVLQDVEDKALTGERARRKLDIERQIMDRRPQLRGVVPGIVAKSGHRAI